MYSQNTGRKHLGFLKSNRRQIHLILDQTNRIWVDLPFSKSLGGNDFPFKFLNKPADSDVKQL